MDRLAPIVTGKQLLRGLLVVGLAVAISYLVAPRIVGPEWSGFATTLLAIVPLLAWIFAMFFNKRRQDAAIEQT